MKTTRSQKLFSRAQQLLPGGVDCPVRAFKSVGGSPLFIARASGATLVDVDGNKYVDYVMSWGPLIHGHAPKGLTQAIARAAKDGTSFGAPSPRPPSAIASSSFRAAITATPTRFSSRRARAR